MAGLAPKSPTEGFYALAERIDELAGNVAALIAITVTSPHATEENIKMARGLIGALAPSPIGQRIGTPLHSAQHTLDKIESMLNSIRVTREAGGRE